jgi:hypothetical protein
MVGDALEDALVNFARSDKMSTLLIVDTQVEAGVRALHHVTLTRIQLDAGSWHILLNAHQGYSIPKKKDDKVALN